MSFLPKVLLMDGWDRVVVVALPVGLLALFFLLLRGKRFPVRFYAGCEKKPEGEGTGYYEEGVKVLGRSGFLEKGWGMIPSIPMHARVAVFVSEDMRTIAVCEGGRLLMAPVMRTCFYSRLSDGGYVVTSDGMRDYDDVSGLTSYMIRTRLAWPNLILAHRGRLEQAEKVVAWTGEISIETVNGIMEEQVKRMVETKVARWTDDTHTQWQLGTKGVSKGYGRGFLLAIKSYVRR